MSIRVIIPSSGSGSTSIKQTEVDVGSLPVNEATFVVVDTDVSASSKIIAQVAGVAPSTGRPLEEILYDRTTVIAQPGSGQVTLFLQAFEGYLVDAFVVNYAVG